MHNLKKAGIVAAATVLVAVGCVERAGGRPPTPAAPAAPAASASPAAGAATPPLSEGPLQPGRYALSWDGPPMTIEVPAGWEGTEAGLGKFVSNAEVAWGGWSEPVTRVFGDACQERDDHVPVDGTLQGIVDALDAQGSTDATITDVTIGGFAGKRIMLAPSAGVGATVCQTGDPGLLQIWEGPPGVGYFALTPGASGRVDLIETDDGLVTFVGVVGAEAAASDLAELESIIASGEFGT